MAALEEADERGNRLLELLPGADRRWLLDHLELVELDLGQPVDEPGKPIEDVYFPLTTVISMLAVMDDGQAVEVATMGREGMAGLPVFLGATSSPDRAVAQVPGRALGMSAGEFRELANGAGTVQGLVQRYPRRSCPAGPGAACNRLHSTDQRLARWLLLTHDRVGQDQFPPRSSWPRCWPSPRPR